MDYHYETLNHETFQKLAQALIVAQFPYTQCLPVGQPDGGRDAVFVPPEATRDQFVVFQVKFSRAPEEKSERDAINGLVRSELHKVQQLARQGATHYYFVTNVRGTAHPDVGSIDIVNDQLTETFGIPVYIWWRDDLDRRLDNYSDVKWSYPEILKASDILPLLIQSEDKQNTGRAVKSYMATQCQADKDVKFKQVELQRSLIDLFVDLPVGLKSSRTDRTPSGDFSAADSSELDAYVHRLDLDEDFDDESAAAPVHGGLVGAFLLRMPWKPGRVEICD